MINIKIGAQEEVVDKIEICKILEKDCVVINNTYSELFLALAEDFSFPYMKKENLYELLLKYKKPCFIQPKDSRVKYRIKLQDLNLIVDIYKA